MKPLGLRGAPLGMRSCFLTFIEIQKTIDRCATKSFVRLLTLFPFHLACLFRLLWPGPYRSTL